MPRRLRELLDLRKFHPAWIVLPVVAGAVTAGGILWLSESAVPDAPSEAQPAPPRRTASAERLPEPDAGEADDAAPAAAKSGPRAFTPPAEADLPRNEFGAAVRRGRDIFVDTQTHAKAYVGNGLNCVNCHLDEGRKADSAPLWAAYVKYPAYRDKNKKVNSYEDRLAGCFRFSMNGKPPPYDSPEMVALVTYSYWLAQGAPTGAELRGRGYPKLEKPAQPPDARRGADVFAQNCALCHGADGEGTRVGGRYAFPPLWGPHSYNGGAGMHRVETAAAFIHANMPLGKPKTLTLQEAWDVAQFVDSHDRPPDPRKR